jgi:hypothetical protein
MRRTQLAELLGALERITGTRDVIVIGSQCVHAVTGDPPGEVLMSVECDVLVDEGELSEQIDRELGPTSEFQAEHGVYVDTVPATFPFLPDGWQERAVPLADGPSPVRCLELHDLALSKLAAGRLKDNEMVAALVDRKLVELATLRARVTAVADPHLRAILLARLQIVLESVGS